MIDETAETPTTTTTRPKPATTTDFAARLRGLGRSVAASHAPAATTLAATSAPFAATAKGLGLPGPLAAALKIARNWRDDTMVTEVEVREAADIWLHAIANEGGR